MSPLTFLPRYSSQITEDDNEDHSDGDGDDRDLGVDGVDVGIGDDNDGEDDNDGDGADGVDVGIDDINATGGSCQCWRARIFRPRPIIQFSVAYYSDFVLTNHRLSPEMTWSIEVRNLGSFISVTCVKWYRPVLGIIRDSISNSIVIKGNVDWVWTLSEKDQTKDYFV